MRYRMKRAAGAAEGLGHVHGDEQVRDVVLPQALPKQR
jgi:hypothetical protein